MRFIPIDMLKGDEILGVSIINANNQVLMQEGTKLTDSYINRIRNHGIQSVYIQDEYHGLPNNSVSDTIAPVIRNNSIYEVKRNFEVFEHKIKRQKLESKYSDTGSSLHSAIKNISGNLIDAILSSKNIEIAMQDIKSLTEYNYQHSVNVAVLSLVLGVELGLSSYELENLAFGALLIDCGYQWIDKKLLLKQDKYTCKDYDEVKKHVVFGYTKINENTILNAHVKSIIMHHHERIDGSGYPKGLTDKEIHPLAKIVMIADVYDALTSDRPYRRAYSQHEALEYIMANAGKAFDFKLVNLFSRKIIPYPIGTYVLLSNNQKGIITENNISFPLRPIIRTFGKCSYTGKNTVLLDLLANSNVTIKKIIYTID